jgi:hypothetical protein
MMIHTCVHEYVRRYIIHANIYTYIHSTYMHKSNEPWEDADAAKLRRRSHADSILVVACDNDENHTALDPTESGGQIAQSDSSSKRRVPRDALDERRWPGLYRGEIAQSDATSEQNQQ